MEEVARLIDAWKTARAELAAIKCAEHSDIIDKFGRVWAWKSKDLYVHCGCAAPAYMIDSFALPKQSVLDNSNYDLCDVCIDGRERNIIPCRPEWNCSHTACKN